MKKHFAQISGAVLFLICVGGTIPAQTSEVSPETVAERYTAATRAGNWLGAAQLMHPEALSQLKQVFAPLVEVAPQEVGVSFFNVRSKKEYDQLSNVTVFERLMRNFSKQSPETAIALSASDTKIIGHVKEKPDLAHIVYRINTKVGDVSVSKTAVMTLKKDGESWRTLLTGNIEGLAAVLSRPQNILDKSPKKD
jgi:hypothetical protein